jgi:hypothetical protein
MADGIEDWSKTIAAPADNTKVFTAHLNTIEQDLNTLKQIFNTWQAAGSVGDAAALKSAITSAAWDTNTITLSSDSDYEDPNITH